MKSSAAASSPPVCNFSQHLLRPWCWKLCLWATPSFFYKHGLVNLFMKNAAKEPLLACCFALFAANRTVLGDTSEALDHKNRITMGWSVEMQCKLAQRVRQYSNKEAETPASHSVRYSESRTGSRTQQETISSHALAIRAIKVSCLFSRRLISRLYTHNGASVIRRS